MIEVTANIVNLDEIKRALRARPEAARREIDLAIQKSIIKVERDAKRLAPVNKLTGGGNLRQSIQSSQQQLKGVVQAKVKYAAAVEFGTRPHTIVAKNGKVLANKRTGQFFGKTVNHPGTRAQPYLTPAVTQNQENIKGYFLQAMKNILSVLK